MPTLPAEATQQTVFPDVPLGYRSEAVNPDAGGASVGAALTGASNVMSDVALRRQEIWNEKTTNDALNGLMNTQSQIVTKYKSMLGDNAVNSLDATTKQLNDTVQSYRQNLNPAAQRMYDQQANRYLRFNMGDVSSHWDQQFKQATLDSNQASVDMQVKRAAQSTNPQDYAGAMAQIDALSKSRQQYMGMSDDVASAYASKYKGDAAAGRVDMALASNDYGTAQGILQRYGQFMNPATLETQTRAARQNQADMEALGTARDIYRNSGGNMKHVDDAVFGIADKDMRNEVWKYTREMHSQDMYGQQQAKMERQADMAQRIADQTAELTAGVMPSSPIKPSDLEAAGFNPRQVQHYTSVLTRSANYGSAVQQSSFTTPEQDVQLQQKLKPTVNEEGFALQQEMSDSLNKFLQKKYSDLRSDPAGYVLQNAPAVQQAFSAAFTDPSKLPQAMTKLSAYYDQLGLPPAQRSLLPARVAAEYGQNIAGMGPQQRVQYLLNFSKKVGEYLPATAAQLGKYDPMLGLQMIHANTVDTDGRNVGALLADGSNLLYGRSDAEGKQLDKPSFKLDEKSEMQFKAAFDSNYGAAYSGRADVRSLDEAGVMAVYASKANQASVQGFRQSTFNEAAKSYFGGAPVKVGNSRVFAPYGVDSGLFRQALNQNIEDTMKAHGADDGIVRSAIESGTFIQRGQDQYSILAPKNGVLQEVQDDRGRPLIFSSNITQESQRANAARHAQQDNYDLSEAPVE